MVNYLITTIDGSVVVDSTGDPIYSIYLKFLCGVPDSFWFDHCRYDSHPKQPPITDHAPSLRGDMRLEQPTDISQQEKETSIKVLKEVDVKSVQKDVNIARVEQNVTISLL